jgi:hypothetical protein
VNISKTITDFLESQNSISIGYNEINFITPSMLSDGQIGYSFSPDGNSLMSKSEGSWNANWLVIATDGLGDPIFIDLSLTEFPILTAMHGEGFWEPILISDNFSNFQNIILVLNQLSKDRTNPAALEKKPISEKEADAFLKQIELKNPKSNVSYWSEFIENI